MPIDELIARIKDVVERYRITLTGKPFCIQVNEPYRNINDKTFIQWYHVEIYHYLVKEGKERKES